MQKRAAAICGVLAAALALLSALCLVFGIFTFHRNQDVSNRVFDILAKYGDAYPMPEQEIQALDRLFSGPSIAAALVLFLLAAGLWLGALKSWKIQRRFAVK